MSLIQTLIVWKIEIGIGNDFQLFLDKIIQQVSENRKKAEKVLTTRSKQH